MEEQSFYPRPSAIETAAKNTSDKTTLACGQSFAPSASGNTGNASFTNVAAQPSAFSNPTSAPNPFSSTTHCKNCGKKLTADDKAINFKLISRTVTEFFCIDCLGEKLGCGRAPIEERIKYYRESGNCTLFR